MQRPYFSDRERGARPRTSEEINERVWHALFELIQTNLYNGGFGYKFPDMCPDGASPCGTDVQAFWRTAYGEMPDPVPRRVRLASASKQCIPKS
jgi:hypothetical protein